MKKNKFLYNTTNTMLNNLKKLSEIKGFKRLNSTLDYLITKELEQINNIDSLNSMDIEEYTKQLNQILLTGTKKDLEQFILSNNISLSNYEYWELLQKLDKREIFE